MTDAVWSEASGSTIAWGVYATFCPLFVWDDALFWDDLQIWDEGPLWNIQKTADPTDEV